MAGVDSFVKLLIHSNTTNGSTAFTDDYGGHTITSSSAQHSTAHPGLGSTSIVSTANTGYLLTSSSDAWDLKTGDWTIDFRIYIASTSSGAMQFLQLANNWTDSTFVLWWDFDYNPDKLGLAWKYSDGSSSSAELSINQIVGSWMHIAVERYGTSLNFYRDGVCTSTTTNAFSSSLSLNYTSGSTKLMLLNYLLGGGSKTNIYLDEFRFSKGVARYQGASYVVPTAAYELDNKINFDLNMVSISKLPFSVWSGVSMTSTGNLALSPKTLTNPFYPAVGNLSLSSLDFQLQPLIFGTTPITMTPSVFLATAKMDVEDTSNLQLIPYFFGDAVDAAGELSVLDGDSVGMAFGAGEVPEIDSEAIVDIEFGSNFDAILAPISGESLGLAECNAEIELDGVAVGINYASVEVEIPYIIPSMELSALGIGVGLFPGFLGTLKQSSGRFQDYVCAYQRKY